MTDIHSHIMYDVDDGSQTIEESLELINKLKSVGFTNIILTPHYIDSSEYCSENAEKLEKLDNLKNLLAANNIDVNLYLGNEIFINDYIIDGINDNRIYSMNNSKFILFELPFYNQILNLSDMIYEMKIQGYRPILAHPERYAYFQNNYSLLDELRDEGLLFQANFASILGYYGKESEKLLKYMLKKKYIDYLGTDIHRINRTFTIDNFKKIEKNIIKIAGSDYYNEIIMNGDNLVRQ